MQLSLFLGLLLVTAVSTDCICEYLIQPPTSYTAPDWPNFFIQNPLLNDTQNGQPCIKNCTYKLDSGDDTKGIGGYNKYKWDNDGGVNYMTIYNADKNFNEDTTNPLVYHQKFNDSNPLFTSSSRYVVVQLVVVKPVVILVALDRQPIAAPVTKPPTTVSPPPTTPYSGPFQANPSLISLDVLFMVDGGSNGQRVQAFNESRFLAAAIVDAFNPGAVWAQNATEAPSYGSRMTLRYLTNINNENIGTPWNESPSFISSQVKNVFQVQNSPTNYTAALKHLLEDPNNSPFSITNDLAYSYQNSRNTSQRVAIIVASSLPESYADLGGDTIKDLFIAMDVHPIFIAYNMSDDDTSTVRTTLSPFWGVYVAHNLLTLNDTVKGFFDDFLLDSTKVCNVNTVISGSSQEVHYPDNYKKANNSWNENHQQARYCNFQTFSYSFEATNTTVLQFNVTYELEAGKDFLTFFRDDGSEIVTLSGEDVGPSLFYTMGRTKAVFTTNESQVFGGFSIQYQTTASAPL